MEHTNGLSGLRCLGIDERSDTTRFLIDKEGYTQIEFENKDHYVIVSYSGNVYVIM